MDGTNPDFTTFSVEELVEGVTVDQSAGEVHLSELIVAEEDEFYDPVEERIFSISEITHPANNDVSAADIRIEYEDGRRMELDERTFAYGLTDGRSKQQIKILGRDDPDPWIVPLGRVERP